MKKLITTALLGGAVAASLIGAGSANASMNEFNSYVQGDIPFVVQKYGLAAVQAMGNQVCVWESQGITDTSPLVDRTIAQWPMSRSAAISVQVAAEMYLGC